jgi:Transposase DDE domain
MIALTNNLIKLYFHVCDKYKEQICWEVQRFSNNRHPAGIITDEELITIYLFCVGYSEKYKIKSMYRYIQSHWHCWFPKLPSYQAFNARLNNLWEAFATLIIDFINSISVSSACLKVLLGDSFPVITCSHKRDGKVAPELTDKGFCATKGLHFYGVKVHVFGLRRISTIPFPQYLEVMPASVHDLPACRQVLENIQADSCIADKAYGDAGLARQMQAKNNTLITPVKEKQKHSAEMKQRERAFNDLYNRAVSAIRQPIESLFNWINELTQIQNASKVRSANGLRLHLWGKLASALMLLAGF